jgi:hypothetical protein
VDGEENKENDNRLELILLLLAYHGYILEVLSSEVIQNEHEGRQRAQIDPFAYSTGINRLTRIRLWS